MASRLPSPSRKGPFDGFGSDSDPKGKRDIKPIFPKRRTGTDDPINGAYEQGAKEPESVSGAFPSGQIDKAYSNASSVAKPSTDVKELAGKNCGQGGKQDL